MTRTDLGNIDHTVYSIEPTIRVLETVGIREYEFGLIVSAVSSHTDKLYTGRNLVAKVLRDADKKDSFGPWGTLRHINHHFDINFVDVGEIMKYQDKNEK